MDLIAASGSDCLQMSSSYPQHSLNALAINRMSLADKYHLENMQILAKKPLAEYFLYDIMTNPDIINRPTYREEVKILVNAQSKVKARALYYYIANPNEKFSSDDEYMNDVEYYNDMEYEKTRPLIYSNDYVDGTKDPDYLINLNIINNMDDRLVMHFVSLLMTPAFINSPNKRFDIELLQRIKNPKIFWNLYLLMTEESILDKPYHKKDVVMISETINDKNRHLLLEKAAVHHEDNINHDYDMEYITKLDLESINDEIYKKIRHFLLSYAGINDPNHKEKLEQLAKGIMVRQDGSLSAYLDNLEKELETSIKTIIKSTPATMAKPKSYLLNLFKKR